MIKFDTLCILPIITALFLASCSGKDTRVSPEEFLPESISSLSMDRSSDLLVFRGDSLSYYTNDAQFFRRFNFVDMATADYVGNEIVLEVEIFRFATPQDAYGIYSHMRWGNSDKVIPLGIEGFRALPNIYFVRGSYVVHAMAFDDSEIPSAMLDDLAAYYSEQIPGDDKMPARFDLFPSEGAVAATSMYFPNMFLGMDFMKCVYSCYREIETDTVFLFLACDSAGPMVLEWSETLADDSTFRSLPDDLPYDDGKGFVYDHARYGRIIVGIKNDFMAAILGYSDSHKQFLIDWINSLPEKTT